MEPASCKLEKRQPPFHPPLLSEVRFVSEFVEALQFANTKYQLQSSFNHPQARMNKQQRPLSSNKY
jgi:hypothetical protein